MSIAKPLRVLDVRDGIAVGEVANVCVVVWRGPVTGPRFDVQRTGLREVTRRHAGGAGFLCVIEPSSSPPDHELRRASASMVREAESALRGIACVVEGTGFVGALARSALSAVALIMGPRKVPLSVQGTVSSASVWLAPRVGLEDARALARDVEALRDRLAPLPGRDPSRPS